MDFNHRRILFMEDDEGMARLFQKRIGKLGFMVTIAPDGPSGLEMLKENGYDLVAVDHSMPGMSGLEVIAEIQKSEKPPPVIMVTGAGCERTAAQAMKMGAQDYIVKDLEGVFFELLPSVIAQVFRKQTLDEEKRRTQAALRESEARYRSLVEWSPDGILVLAEDKISFINDSGVRLLGLNSPDEAIGLELSRFLRERDQQPFENGKRKALTVIPPGVWKFETAIVPRVGEPVEVEVAAARVEKEEQPCLQLVLRDITGRKEAEAAITQMNEELEFILRDRTAQVEHLHREMHRLTRNTALDRKATDVLHNVKNVLNSLVVSTNIMERIIDNSKVENVSKVAQLLLDHKADLGRFITQEKKGRMIPEFLTSLARILSKEHCMLRDEIHGLIDNLDHINVTVTLQQSRARLTSSVGAMDPEDLFDETIKICRNSINRHGIELHRERLAPCQMRLDRHKILQILVNLVNNAAKAVEDAHHDIGDRHMYLKLTRDEDNICFAVRDNGVGIPDENMLRLFEYGFTTRQTGHGFGLHSCRVLAEEMSGTLEASSEGPGKGATFRLCVPVLPPEEHEGEASES